jgi:Flp pilus assembly protein TadB
VIALEQVMDAITATALAVSRGATVPASGVQQLCDALQAVSEAAAAGSALVKAPELPEDETLGPVTEAVRALLGVLGTGERLTV